MSSQIILCSVCNRSYNARDVHDIRDHDRRCPPNLRQKRLLEQLNEKREAISSHSSSRITSIPPPRMLIGSSYPASIHKRSNPTIFETVSGKRIKKNPRIVDTANGKEAEDNSSNGNVINEEGDEDSSTSSANDDTESVRIMDVAVQSLFATETQNLTPLSLLQLKEDRENSIVTFSSKERAHLKLLSILRKINAPYHAYNSLLKWASEVNQNDLLERMSMESLIRQTADKFGVSNIFPREYILELPTGEPIGVTRYCFKSQLFSLLDDANLMKEENLVDEIDSSNPLSESHIYADVETSGWMRNTQNSYCILKNTKVIPILLYIDKTHVKGKTCEPISFTLGIFKRRVRCNPAAWRNLGVIPGKLCDLPSSGAHSKLSVRRLNNWHFVCSFLLAGLKQMQSFKDGIDWCFKDEICRIRIPIMFIIGDIEGNDKVCTRKRSHQASSRGVTHSCDITRDICGDPNSKCQMLKALEVCSLQEKYNDPESTMDEKDDAMTKLQDMGFHHEVKNAFMRLDYGENPYGVHGACCVCLMHTFKQRFPDDVIKFVANLFGVDESSKPCNEMNKLIAIVISHSMRQSNRSFPREISCFKVSFFNPKFTMSANEKFARVFALLLFWATTVGWNFFKKRAKPFYKERDLMNLYKLAQQTISIYKFLSRDSFPKTDVIIGQKEVMKYLSLYREVSEKASAFVESQKARKVKKEDEVSSSTSSRTIRTYDNPCQFPKYHYMTHVVPQIQMFGSSKNFNSDMNESLHKEISKAPGQRTQGRLDTFDIQSQKNFASNVVLDKAFRFLQFETSKGPSFSSDQTQYVDGVAKHRHSASFIAEYKEDQEIKWDICYTGHEYEVLHEWLDEILKVKGLKTIHGFSSLQWKGTIIRAHPNYRNDDWYDHVTIQWLHTDNTTYYCPAFVFMFFTTQEEDDEHIYAVVKSAAVDSKNNFRPTKLAHSKWKKQGQPDLIRYWVYERNFQIIHIDSSISNVCFAYEDWDNEDFQQKNGYLIEFKAIEEWENYHGAKR